MTNELISILVTITIISSSGLIINLTKNKQSNVIWQEVTKTLLYFKISVPLSMILSVVFYQNELFPYEQKGILKVFGIIFITSGLLIRWEAIRKLSGLFTVKISIMEDHKLIRSGVYKYIRHPSYTGMIIYFLGLGLLTHDYLSIGILIVLPMSAILIRIYYEEKALNAHFKEEYTEYKKKSWKLVPLIY